MASQRMEAPIPKPHPGSEGGSGSSDSYENPLAGMPPPMDMAAQAPAPKAANPDGAAWLFTKAVNAAAVARYQMPLTEKESADVHRDFSEVYKKYDLPDLPMMAEGRLAITLIEIGFNRHLAEQQQMEAAAAQQPQKVANDRPRAGQEGKRQVNNLAESGFPSNMPSTPDILS